MQRKEKKRNGQLSLLPSFVLNFRLFSLLLPATHLTFINSMIPFLQELYLKCICAQRRLMWCYKSCVICIKNIARWQNMPITTSDPRYLILAVYAGDERWKGNIKHKTKRENVEKITNNNGKISYLWDFCRPFVRRMMMNTEMKVLCKAGKTFTLFYNRHGPCHFQLFHIITNFTHWLNVGRHFTY